MNFSTDSLSQVGVKFCLFQNFKQKLSVDKFSWIAKFNIFAETFRKFG